VHGAVGLPLNQIQFTEFSDSNEQYALKVFDRMPEGARDFRILWGFLW
jgi:hypothetical protein